MSGRRFGSGWVGVAAAVLSVWSSVASASPADTAGLAKFEEGKKAFEAGQFEAALPAFKESLTLLPSPNTRLYLARCYRALAKPASAYTQYRLSAREASDRMSTTGEQRYKATRDIATSEAAEIEPKVPRLTLAVPADVPAATSIRIDGVDVPRAAWGTSIETDPGRHHVAASGARRRPFDQQVELHDGEQVRIDVNVERLPTGTLVLHLLGKPSGLDVRVDGAPLDASTWDAPREVDVGEHEVVARAPGYQDFTWRHGVADGERRQVEVTLAPAHARAGTPKWLFVTTLGLAAGALGAGTVLAASAKSKADAQTQLDPLARDPAKRDSVQSLSTDANVMFAVAGVFAAGAGVLFFTTPWHPHGATTGFSPVFGPRSAGLSAKVGF